MSFRSSAPELLSTPFKIGNQSLFSTGTTARFAMPVHGLAGLELPARVTQMRDR
jgi:hypothetical protein